MATKEQKVGKVPNLRFPEFEGEWVEKRLHQVTTYVDYRGKAPSKTGQGHFLVTAKNIKKGFIDYDTSKEYVSEKDYLSVMSKGLPEIGDVLFTTEAPMGNVALVDNKNIALAQRVIKFSGASCLENSYLLYYMLSDVFQKNISEKAIGTTVQGISGKELHKININFPRNDEQIKIANFLSLIDERIQCQNKIIHQLETLIRNLREKIFKQQIRFKDENGNDFPDWEVKKLGEIAKIFDGTHQTPNYVDKGIPFFSVENVTANNFTNTKYISKDVFEKENKRVKIELGDILMTRIGDIGTVRYIDWEAKASFYVSLALIKQSKHYNSEYLAHHLATDKFQSELWNRTIHVAFPKKINLGEIGECLVSVPCYLEQTYIANYLTAYALKIETEKQILEQYKKQKAYLLQQMFI